MAANGFLPYFNVPGYILPDVSAMLEYGREVRDTWLWKYNILPGAVLVFQQMCSGREWRVSGSARGVARTVEWLNNTVTYNYNGIVEYGFEQYLKRRVLDYLCVGRTSFIVENDPTSPLRYADPSRLIFNFEPRQYWYDAYTEQQYSVNEVFVHHPVPIGGAGNFIAPITPVLSTAQLDWLINEHDKAATDGRKIRDIIVTGNRELALSMQEGIQKSLELWSGADPTKNGVPIVFLEAIVQGVKVSDMIHRIGIANIPENFDRQGFEFKYVNEISAHLGLALRHFWNSEKATNRALEEVQEARQSQKGPSSFVRTEQRLLNDSGVLKRFGRNIKFGFIEEVDLQSRKVNAEVLKLYAEGLNIFSTVFNGVVNGDAFLAWLQSEGILPPDLELVTDLNTIENSDQMPVPQGENETIQEGDISPTPISTGKSKSVDLDYDEIVMDQNGKVVDRRRKVVTVEKIIEREISQDPQLFQKVYDSIIPDTFEKLLVKARQENAQRFFSLFSSTDVISNIPQEKVAKLFENKDQLTENQHQLIFEILETFDNSRKEIE